MEFNRRLELSSKQVEKDEFPHGSETWLPPWFFKHEELIHVFENATHLDQDTLINVLNHIHFTEEPLFILLHHPSYQEDILLRAYPEPCLGDSLTCSWIDPFSGSMRLEASAKLFLVIDNGQSLIMVPSIVKDATEGHVTVQLPSFSYEVGKRKSRRHLCMGVTVELIQNGFQAKGELIDFCSYGFRVKVKPESNCSFRWYNPDVIATVHFRHGQQMYFSGGCRCIRQKEDGAEREFVFIPLDQEIKRFRKKQMRNIRQELVPSPSISFTHPLLGRKIQLPVQNVSTSGFSVLEDEDERVLMAGMVIPELEINFMNALKIACSAQVIYSQAVNGKEIRSGLAILDMDIKAYSRLTDILINALDPHARISNEVDLDALWKFFFEAGFLYSKKYRLVQSNRLKFKETYKKLYQADLEVARHFTYQKNGRIYGHISMVRAYERTWMIHHHAAKSMESKRTGFLVLKQIMHYLNDMHRLPSANMDYVISYFRPENKFPDRVFGRFCRELNNPKGCSMDLFAYLPYTSLSLGTQLPENWSLQKSSLQDLWEFKQFYRHISGGLLLEAIALGNKEQNTETLEELYNKLGLVRRWVAYSLSYKGTLHAILIVNQSSLGFNLSELLNGIKVFVIQPENLPWNTLSIAIAKLTGDYQSERVPILFYPFSYVEERDLPYEKKYQFWVLNVQYGNEYMEYMQNKFKIGYH